MVVQVPRLRKSKHALVFSNGDPYSAADAPYRGHVTGFVTSKPIRVNEFDWRSRLLAMFLP